MKLRYAILTLLLLAGCESASFENNPVGTESVSTTQSTTHIVEYRVTGDALSVSVTFQNENGDTSQQGDQAVPWTYSLTAEEGEFLYVSAQNQGATGGTTCSIYVDGQEAESNSSSGAYAICTASGSL